MSVFGAYAEVGCGGVQSWLWSFDSAIQDRLILDL